MTQKIFPWLARTVLAGLVLVSGVQAAPYSSLVVFGDSLSDSGNNAKLALDLGADGSGQVISGNNYIPGLPYASGVYSNGPVWTTQFAASAGLTLAPSEFGGSNYAYGGARVGTDKVIEGITIPGLTSQIGTYMGSLNGSPAPANGLFVLAGGGNTARDIAEAAAQGTDVTSAIQGYAVTMATMVGQLQALGAQHIVVWNVPNIGLTPAAIAAGPQASQGASFLAGVMNSALTSALSMLPSAEGVQVFDLYGLMGRAQASGNFTNLTDACGNLQAACNANLPQSLFWDGIHPTTAAHAMIASEMLTLTAAVPEPAEYAMFFAGLLVLGTMVRRQRRS